MIFFIRIRISKNLSAKCYQENKKKTLQKKLFLMKKKQKRDNIAVKVRKIFHKMENKSLLSIEKNIIK